MLFAPLAIRSGFMGVSRAKRLQHRRGVNRLQVSSGARRKHRGFASEVESRDC